MKKYILFANSGQAVLMLVLITIVGLTIGLSLIARTVTDIRISSQIEQSSRAFSAAEAGVQNALSASVVNQSGSVNLPGATGNYSISKLGGNSNVIDYELTHAGSSQILWLIDHKDDRTLDETATSYSPSSNLDICWGSDDTQPPGIKISLFYNDSGTYKVAYGAYDHDNSQNNFDSTPNFGSNFCDFTYRFKKTINPNGTFGIPVTAKLLYMRIQPVDIDTPIAVKPYASIPQQANLITSVGQTDTGVVRKIQVVQGYPAIPELFDFSFFTSNMN